MNKPEKLLASLAPDDLAYERFYGMRYPLSFIKDTMSPHVQKAHVHDFAQLWYCVSGSCRNIIGDKSYPLDAGNLVIVPCGVAHSLVIETDSQLFSFSLSPEIFLKTDMLLCKELSAYMLAPSLFSDSGAFSTRAFSLSLDSQHEICDIFSRLCTSADLDLSAILKYANKIFLLPELTADNGELEPVLCEIEKSILPIIKASAYINANFADKITTKELLHESLLCQTTFFSLFKQFMGMRASTYIQRLRTSHAVFYLSHTSYDISKISDVCGFNTPSHFVLCHKKHTGLLPKYLRTKLKEYYENNPVRNIKKPNPFD